MKSKQTVLFSVALVVFMTAGISCAADSEKAALKAAQSWLGLVDAGQYDKSWDQAAKLFKAALSMKKWEQALNAARKPLGLLLSRKVQSAKFATSLPGAPDGEYVVILFASSFTNKKSAIETVTPMRDPDGVWRVSGYYIK